MKRQASDAQPQSLDGSGSTADVKSTETLREGRTEGHHDSKKAKIAHSIGPTSGTTEEKPGSPVEEKKTSLKSGEAANPAPSAKAENPTPAGKSSKIDSPPNIPDFSTPNPMEEAGPISYAEAVLAGLPPDDEAVQMANLAKQSGKTLDDLVEFCYVSAASGAGGASTIVTDPFTGKSVALGEGNEVQEELDGNLYKDMHGWCDSRNIEEQLRAVKEVRMNGLPKQGWKKKNKQKKKG
ncbi:hypothetical protein BSKO_10668 [Bryopsis sp. KO-2023]|nr:hypothetical protein BSKO_10668 [Bryopsis sp. KO-2023]